MIGKKAHGGRGGWCGGDDYITGKEGSELLETNMAGDNSVERAEEARIIADQNLRVKNTQLHISISPHPDDRIEDDTWRYIGTRIREGLGYANHQYILATHDETGLRHGHLLINRVRIDGKVPSDFNEQPRLEEILRGLEEELDLTPVMSSRDTILKSPSTGQIQKAKKEQKQFEEGKRASPPEPPVMMVLQEMLRLATEDSPTMTELLDRLERQDVRTEIRLSPEGRHGISFSFQGHSFRGSGLSREFSWQGLQELRGVSLDWERDAQAIDAAVNRRKETEQLQEQGNGTQGTAKAGSQTASRGTSNSDVSKRRSKGASRSSSSTEPAALQSDEGEFRIEAAASQLNESARHFARRLEQVDKLSRERTEQPSRNLAVAPNGAGSKSGGAGEEPAAAEDEFNIAGQLDQFGAAVHEFNAELESPPVRHQAAGNYSRTESREARASNSRTVTTTGWSQADVHRQFEQLNRIHDGIRRQRESEIEELEKRRAELKQLSKELAAGTNQVNPANESYRAGVEESDSTRGMAGTLDSLSRRNQELAATSFKLTSGIKQLSAELTGETVGHRVGNDRRREQSTETQAIGHHNLVGESRTNTEKHRSTERTQQLHETVRNTETESTIGEDLSVRNQEAGTVWVDPKMREDADLVLSIAARAYKYLDARQKVTEVSPGVMVAETTDYTLTLQPEDEILSIAAKDGRGEIVRYEVDKLTVARNIQPSDVEEWLGIEQKLDKIEMQQQEAERQKEVERQRQLQQQKKRDQLSL